MKKVIAFLLACITMLSFAACGKNDSKNEGESTMDPGGSVSTTGGDEEKPDPAKTLTLEEGLDFGGKRIIILQRENFVDEMYFEKPNGDLVGDTIWERNKQIESKLNVKLDFIKETGTNKTFSTYKAKITAAAAAADSEELHIVANYAYYCSALAIEGVYHDFNELNPVKKNHLCLDKVWWNQNYQSEATVNEKLYFLEGDITVSAINRLEVLFYNMDLAESYFPGVDFLEKVYSKEFTYEYFLDCIAAAGDGETTGVWGVSMPCNSTSIDGFIASLDVDIVQRNSRGTPEVSFNTDRTISIKRELRKLYQENNSALALDTGAGETVTKFVNGNAIFHINMMQNAASDQFRNLAFEYAIIPLPVWNEDQENYMITAHDEYSTLSIPLCVLETDAVSAVLEYMGYLSYTNLRPVLYEKCYKAKYLATLPKAKMFDFIIDNAFFDFGYIYSNSMGDPVHILRDNIRYPNKNSLVADITSGASTSDTKLRDFIAKFYD